MARAHHPKRPARRRASPKRLATELLDRWVQSKVRRNCVARTIRRYQDTVRSTLRWLRERRRPVHPRHWTIDDALAIKAFRRSERWSLSVLNDFARFHGSGVISEAGIPKACATGRVRWLSRAQAEHVLDAARGDPRLWLVAVLGLGQGMRRVEWQRMRLEDLDVGGGRLLVRGKGRGGPKLLWAPLHPALLPAVRAFLRVRRRLVAAARARDPHAADPPELLVHRRGSTLSPYSLSGLDLLVDRIGRRLRDRGEAVRLSSHMFRRSGATLLEETLLELPEASKDGVYRTIQGFLRHENLATTMKYLDANPGRQRRALERYATALPWGGTARR